MRLIFLSNANSLLTFDRNIRLSGVPIFSLPPSSHLWYHVTLTCELNFPLLWANLTLNGKMLAFVLSQAFLKQIQRVGLVCKCFIKEVSLEEREEVGQRRGGSQPRLRSRGEFYGGNVMVNFMWQHDWPQEA